METNDKKGMARREFLKRLGVGTAATAAALTGCDSRRNAATGDHTAQGEIPTDRMTYRINPKTGEQVSLLGYGCMRWPTLSGGSARDGADEIDQEEVNRLVDFAIAHGVNYFDTSPAYCKGHSERATGIALKRHPRESYYIATKLSNFAPSTWSREASMAMYRNSFKELQVDRIDYLLLHGVGMGGGMKEFEARYIDNGILDFLLSEREAGRIRNLGFSYHGDIAVFDRLLAEHDRYRWDFVQIQLNYVDWRHAKEVNTRNTDAEYLYGELSRRGIPAVIMEPLLGGRLSNVHDHIAAKLRQRHGGRSRQNHQRCDRHPLHGLPLLRRGVSEAYRHSRLLRALQRRPPVGEPPLFDPADLLRQPGPDARTRLGMHRLPQMRTQLPATPADRRRSETGRSDVRNSRITG